VAGGKEKLVAAGKEKQVAKVGGTKRHPSPSSLPPVLSLGSRQRLFFYFLNLNLGFGHSTSSLAPNLVKDFS